MPLAAEVLPRIGPAQLEHLEQRYRKSNREFEYSVDVLGTKNVLEACVATGVGRIVVTSSGAAYGYYADNPPAIAEDWPLRGNPAFAYADQNEKDHAALMGAIKAGKVEARFEEDR